MTAQDQINRLAAEVAALKRQQTQCAHAWSEAKADHIYHEAYTEPGDPPGTMGVDWRGPCYVPARIENRWTRTCTKCGLTQSTGRAETVVVKSETKPIFP